VRPQPRLYETVVTQLLDIIATRRLRPGSALPTERDLEAELGISRSVIRQGFSVLEDRGLIVTRRGAGRYVRQVPEQPGVPQAVVAKLEVASIADILEARILLEEQVVVLACQRRTREEAQRLNELAERLHSWEDNLTFHTTIAAATHNFMLERLVRQQAELLGELHQRDRYSSPTETTRMRSEHQAIAAAVTTRDEALARDLVRDHLQRTRRVVFGGGEPAPPAAEAAPGAGSR
jgi:GntR family transcriptional regulator, transcriptional repressor for pyruvate dehydrogenase complex